MFDRRLFRNFDFLLLLVVCAIMFVSLLVISSATLENDSGDPFFYAKRQATWVILGLLVLLVTLSIDYTQIYRLAPYLYALNLLLLIAVLFFGREAGGAQRWLDLKIFDFQPAEFSKIILIVSLARLLASREGNFDSFFSTVPALIHVLVPTALILRQPDLDTSIVIIVIVFSMLFMAGAKMRHLLLYIVLGAASSVLFYFYGMQHYQKMRFVVFLNPGKYPLGYGYQLMQSLIAIGSGGVGGKGLFVEGTQSRLAFLPAQHTDFIFSVLAEETGFLGAAALLVLFALMVFRILRTAANAKDTFGALVCTGVAGMFTFQILVNIGMATGVMPVAGLTLPFMSYGGSSLVSNLIAVGLVLNVGMRRHKLTF
ncbi:MAG: rod shape-determining protein RodA [Firmicutes bacterium]|nr:rod shape-determining protein RodA [Bacillota bacterium]